MSSSSTKPFGSPERGDGESVRSPYAPKRGRGATDPSGAGDDDPPPPRFLVSSRNPDDQDPDLTNFTESSLQFREAPPVQGSHLRRPSERRSPAYGREEPQDDIDLQRLEESVRRLQREASVNRARTDAPPTAAPTAHPDDARSRRRRSDTYIDGYRVPPSLQPEVLTPPAELRDGRGRLWTLMSMLIASAVAAPIAYYFASGSSSTTTDARLASAETRPAVETLTVTAPAVPARPQSVQQPARQSFDVARAPESESPPVTVVPRRTPVAPPPVQSAPPPAPPPVQNVVRAPPPAETVERAPPAPHLRALDAAEIEVLVKQGQQFVAAGDFVTARLVFQRAAEAGNAAAALALGASYDPVVLSRLGVRGVDADVGKARAWYQKAKDFGAPDADRRLSALANR